MRSGSCSMPGRMSSGASTLVLSGPWQVAQTVFQTCSPRASWSSGNARAGCGPVAVRIASEPSTGTASMAATRLENRTDRPPRSVVGYARSSYRARPGRTPILRYERHVQKVSSLSALLLFGRLTRLPTRQTPVAHAEGQRVTPCRCPTGGGRERVCCLRRRASAQCSSASSGSSPHSQSSPCSPSRIHWSGCSGRVGASAGAAARGRCCPRPAMPGCCCWGLARRRAGRLPQPGCGLGPVYRRDRGDRDVLRAAGLAPHGARSTVAVLVVIGGVGVGILAVLALLRGGLPESSVTRALAPLTAPFAVVPRCLWRHAGGERPIHRPPVRAGASAAGGGDLRRGGSGAERPTRIVRGRRRSSLLLLMPLLLATQARGAFLALALAATVIAAYRTRLAWLIPPLAGGLLVRPAGCAARSRVASRRSGSTSGSGTGPARSRCWATCRLPAPASACGRSPRCSPGTTSLPDPYQVSHTPQRRRAGVRRAGVAWRGRAGRAADRRHGRRPACGPPRAGSGALAGGRCGWRIPRVGHVRHDRSGAHEQPEPRH